jgi:hypothetical protein
MFGLRGTLNKSMQQMLDLYLADSKGQNSFVGIDSSLKTRRD